MRSRNKIIRSKVTGSRKTIHSKVEGSNIRNRIEDSRGMRSHSRAIHSSKAIPRIIRNRGMGSNKIIPSRDTFNNKAIPNKVMHNKDTGSNRAMDNHLPRMLRPKKRRP